MLLSGRQAELIPAACHRNFPEKKRIEKEPSGDQKALITY
jgi:hypothetical protein